MTKKWTKGVAVVPQKMRAKRAARLARIKREAPALPNPSRKTNDDDPRLFPAAERVTE